MERSDIHGVERAPSSIAQYLLIKGGSNPFGEPNFRLVLSSNVMKYQGGRFQDWDKNLSVAQRGGLVMTDSGLVVPSTCRPDRVVLEVRMVPKYLFESGWVLQRWMPPYFYGSRVEWEARCVPFSKEPGAPLSSVPYGGPFPERGDYEMCHYTASTEIPSITELQNAIDRSDRTRETHREDTAQVALERCHEAQFDYHEQMRKEREESEAIMRDILAPMHNTSLGMGRHRSRLAERMGIRSHVGN